MESFEQLMITHIWFTLQTFSEATALSSLLKLREETNEAIMALIKEHAEGKEEWRTRLAEEYADCMMCIVDSATRAGINPAHLKLAFAAKINKNMSRTWINNPNNTYSHIKTPTK